MTAPLQPRPIYPKHFFATSIERRHSGCILMPFDNAFEPIHAAIRAGVADAGLEPFRADDRFNTRAGMEKILKGLEEAEAVIADMTGRNPNVFYEAGIAHTRKDNVVLLAQRAEDIPFDLRHVDHLIYDPTPVGLVELTRKLADVLRGLPPEPESGASVSVLASTPISSRVKVLYWESGRRSPDGVGLIVHNIGATVALELEGQRVLPDGHFDYSRSLRSLNPGERKGIDRDWTSAKRPTDTPDAAPPGKYYARVLWDDPDGARHASAWEVVDMH